MRQDFEPLVELRLGDGHRRLGQPADGGARRVGDAFKTDMSLTPARPPVEITVIRTALSRRAFKHHRVTGIPEHGLAATGKLSEASMTAISPPGGTVTEISGASRPSGDDTYRSTNRPSGTRSGLLSVMSLNV